MTLSSATPVPGALAMATLPRRHASISPGAPSIESRRKTSGIEPLAVDARVDDVDALRGALGIAAVDLILHDDQLVTLDECRVHLVGEQLVFVVRGVVRPGGEHDDVRVPLAWRDALQDAPQPPGVAVDRTDRGKLEPVRAPATPSRAATSSAYAMPLGMRTLSSSTRNVPSTRTTSIPETWHQVARGGRMPTMSRR